MRTFIADKNGKLLVGNGKAYLYPEPKPEKWKRPEGWPDLDAIYKGMGSPENTILLTIDTTISSHPFLSFVLSDITGSVHGWNAEVWDYSDIDNPVQIGTTYTTTSFNGVLFIDNFGTCTYPVVICRVNSGNIYTWYYRSSTVEEVTYNGTYSCVVETKGHAGEWIYTTNGNSCSAYLQRESMAIDKCSNLRGKFSGALSLRSIDFSGWETSDWKVTRLDYMFFNCLSLEYIDFSSWDTSNWAVTTLNNMFHGCRSIKELDFSGWDTSNWVVPSLLQMFQECYSLKKLDFSGWDTSNWAVTNANNFLSSASSLSTLDTSGWSHSMWGSTVTFSNFTSVGTTPGYRDLSGFDLGKVGITTITCGGEVIFGEANNGKIGNRNITMNAGAISLASILRLADALAELPSGTTHTVTLGTANLPRLSEEQKALFTDKGWTLA